jgi:hypothetical protein
MADQPNEKAEAAAPAVDAQETLSTENKTAEPGLAEEKEKTGEEASKDDANVAEGRSIFVPSGSAQVARCCDFRRKVAGGVHMGAGW